MEQTWPWRMLAGTWSKKSSRSLYDHLYEWAQFSLVPFLLNNTITRSPPANRRAGLTFGWVFINHHGPQRSLKITWHPAVKTLKSWCIVILIITRQCTGCFPAHLDSQSSLLSSISNMSLQGGSFQTLDSESKQCPWKWCINYLNFEESISLSLSSDLNFGFGLLTF